MSPALDGHRASPDRPPASGGPLLSFLAPPIRCLIGGCIGGCAWAALHAVLPSLPLAARFVVAWLLFTFGPGAALGARLTRSVDPLRRVIVLLGLGSAATPILVEVLGRAHLLGAFPYVAMALGGIGLAMWVPQPATEDARTSGRDAIACATLVALALGLGTIAFAHRLVPSQGGFQIFGNYDSFDLSFYAVWAAEASHTVPPTASYYAGHALNAAYYPQLVLAMVHRFAGVPLLPIYFRYAWPAFLSLGALTAFVLVRSLAPAGVAWLAVALILVGGDFSYLAARLLPHATDQWDFLIWPTNFFSTTMEVLLFNTWAPSLPVFFTALYAIVRGTETPSRGWTLISAMLLATLFQFKPFAYAVILAGLVAAAVFSHGDRVSRRRFGATMVLAMLFTLPFLYSIASLHEDRRSRLLIDFFLLPQRMLIKLDLTAAVTNLAARLAPAAPLGRPLFLFFATALFFLGGLGIRWVAIPAVWRAIRRAGGTDAAAWRVLGWCAVAGAAIPFVLVTDPYVDTLQFYQAGLYVLWIFTAVALAAILRAHRAIGGLAIVVAVALALPSSIHFLAMKWTDATRPALVEISRADINIANYLRTLDPDTTVVLHNRPSAPSLLAVVSDRRVVLGWARAYYAVGSEGRARDVNAFYTSARGDPAAALETLRRYHVTHVVVSQSDHVHPDVLAWLRPVMRFPDVTLYTVP